MKKLYVAKDEKGRYFADLGGWSKDINKAALYMKKENAKSDGLPVRVNIVEAEDD
jgi:hypothetical protein